MKLTWKEIKALKDSKYADKQDSYPKSYVMYNKRTKQLIEIRGFSALHACKSIGWRLRHVQIIKVEDVGVTTLSGEVQIPTPPGLK